MSELCYAQRRLLTSCQRNTKATNMNTWSIRRAVLPIATRSCSTAHSRTIRFSLVGPIHYHRRLVTSATHARQNFGVSELGNAGDTNTTSTYRGEVVVKSSFKLIFSVTQLRPSSAILSGFLGRYLAVLKQAHGSWTFRQCSGYI